jgi:hypothetical protein
MRICVFGAGAVGGHFAAKLAAAGHDVSVVARGPNLVAIRQNGLTLRIGARQVVGRVRASDRPGDLGEQDIVISTLKAPGLASLAEGSRRFSARRPASSLRRTASPGGIRSASRRRGRSRPTSRASIPAARWPARSRPSA